MTKTRDLSDFLIEGGADLPLGKPHIVPGVLYPAYNNKRLDGTDLVASTTGPAGSTVASSKYGTVQANDGRMYYYTDIKGSKPIKDPRIGAHFGSQRHKFKSIQLLEQETATHGKNVYSVDGREWIRAVGSNFEQEYNTKGNGIKISKVATDTNFIEIVGYFSDANIIRFTAADNDHLRVALNGGTIQATDLGVGGDSPLSGRYVDDGSVINLAFHSSSTPVLGINTVKILNTNADEYHINGIELIAQDTTSTANRSKIQIPSQDVVSYGKKFTVSGTPHYDPFNGFVDDTTLFSAKVDTATSLGLGTATTWGASWDTGSDDHIRPFNGGRVVKWVDSGGTIKTSVTMMPRNAQNVGTTASNEITTVSSTNTQTINFSDDAVEHSLSEVAKTFHWREFGNGNANGGKVSSSTGGSYKDVSMLESTADVAFVMDDGLTSFSGDDVNVSGYDYAVGSATGTPSGDLFYITFIGTGLTLSLPSSSATEIGTQYTIAQNLPYGTHVYKQERSGSNGIHTIDGVVVATSAPNGAKYIAIHQPKRPPIPEDACVLADYMLMADFVGATSGGIGNISKGVRMQSATRDIFYDSNGTITLTYDVSFLGQHVYRNSAGDGSEFKLPYFGEEVCWKGYAGQTGTGTITEFINSTSITIASEVGSTYSARRNTSGQNLGLNGIKFHNSGSAGSMSINWLEVASPIHTSSHYQSFETPFLHELVGGDRNMEQTNLIVTPDGKSWDEVTRDTSYIGNTELLMNDDEGDWNTDQDYKLARGENTGVSSIQKDFAIGYDRFICLVGGNFSITYHGMVKHDSNSYQILKNGSVVSQSRTTYTTNTHGVAFCHVNLSLVRGDRIQTAGQRYLGGNWGHLIIERV